jgi:hypothetical protein
MPHARWITGIRRPIWSSSGRVAPAAVEDELDPIVCGIRCGLAEGAEQSGIEVGHGRDVVVEDRHPVEDGAVGRAERTGAVAATTVAACWEGRPTDVAVLRGHR